MPRRPTPTRSPWDATGAQPRLRRGPPRELTLVLLPARQHARATARPEPGAWIVVLAGGGIVGSRHRLLRPGTIVRLSSDDGLVTAAAEGLAYLTLHFG